VDPSATIPTRLSRLAVASLLFGLFCATGPVAAVLGWAALRAINGSEGRLRGAGLAVAGLALGGVSTALLVVGSLAIVALSLREASNRAECRFNLREIGLAVNLYADNTNETFPPATLPAAGLPREQRFSWLAGILPYMEPRPNKTFRWKSLADRLDYGRPWDDPANLPAVRTNVPRFLCPSCPHLDPRANPGLTHYVGIAGVDPDAPSLPAGHPRAGFFGYDRLLKPADLTAGAGNTLMTAETTADNGPWAAGVPSTVRGVDPDAAVYIGPGHAFGGCHRDGTVDLLQAAFADAHVEVIKATVSPQIFRDRARIARDPGGG
jgi:hypothetical protein